MSTNAAFPPYEMTTDDGGFEGIDVEVAQAIAEKLGLELVVDDMGFDAASPLCRPARVTLPWPASPSPRSVRRSWTSPTAMPPVCRWSL